MVRVFRDLSMRFPACWVSCVAPLHCCIAIIIRCYYYTLLHIATLLHYCIATWLYLHGVCFKCMKNDHSFGYHNNTVDLRLSNFNGT